jgi:hypothetical protein
MTTDHDRADRDIPGVAPALMRELVDAGTAQPLMADHWPVPVRWLERWWYIRDAPTTAEERAIAPADIGAFVPAPAALAEQCESLARRYAAASAAVTATGAGDEVTDSP